MVTSSREVAQTFLSATSKWGLNREARASLLRVRTGPESPEGNKEKKRERERSITRKALT